MAITPLNGSFDLTPPQGNIDPRELMIEKLSEQNENLLATMDKAQSIFHETQTKQKEAIENLSKTNDELREALLKAEARNQELQLAHEKEINALKEKHQLQIDTVKEDIQIAIQGCEQIAAHIKQVQPYVEACSFKNALQYGDGTIQDTIHGWGWISISGYVNRLMEQLDDTFKDRVPDVHTGLKKISEEFTFTANSIANKLNRMKETLKT